MSKQKALRMLVEDVAGGTTQPPDEYQEWNSIGYAGHRSDLLEHWRVARDGIKRDLDKVPQIDELLEQALASFDRGERQPGRGLMVKIYVLLTQPTRIA